MQSDNLPKQETHDQKLEYYRTNYFLDPQGSNTITFIKNSTEMLKILLEKYTGRNIEIKDMNIDVSDKKYSVKIFDKNAVEKNTSELLPGGKLRLNGNNHSIEETILRLGEICDGEIKFNEYFIGQMHPHDNIASFVAGIAAKFINGNTIAKEVSQTTTELEYETIRYLGESFGYKNAEGKLNSLTEVVSNHNTKSKLETLVKEDFSGNLTVGGTMANFAAYLVARNKAYPTDKLKNNGGAENGLFDKEAGIILGSEFSHYSHKKLAGYVGLGKDSFVEVKTQNHKIIANDEDEKALKKQMWKMAQNGKKVVGVFATAGTTETGNIDDLEGIVGLIDTFEKDFGYRPHFHVDAAHGGGYVFHDAFNPNTGGALKGIEKADSITVDPHKMLYTNYNAGAILFKNAKDHQLLTQSAAYLFKNDGQKNLGQKRTEGSMGLDAALQTWASLYALGKEGYNVIQEHTLRMTSYLKNKIESEGFEVLNEPEMNLLCFRYNNAKFSPAINDDINSKAQKHMYEKGIAYISNEGGMLYRKNPQDKDSHINSFRAVIMHPYTTEKEIDVAVNEVKNGITEVLAEYVASVVDVSKNYFHK